MDWYTSKHSLINYTAYCRKFDADVVVVMHAINDLYRSFSPPDFSVGKYESDYSHFYGPSIYGAKPQSFSQMLYKNFRKVWFGKNVKSRDFEKEEFISKNDFERLIPWLEKKREGLTVLIHALTGDNLLDHTEYAYWLGKEEILNLSIFNSQQVNE